MDRALAKTLTRVLAASKTEQLAIDAAKKVRVGEKAAEQLEKALDDLAIGVEDLHWNDETAEEDFLGGIDESGDEAAQRKGLRKGARSYIADAEKTIAKMQKALAKAEKALGVISSNVRDVKSMLP